MAQLGSATPAQRYAACLMERRAGDVGQLMRTSDIGIAQRIHRGLADDSACFARTFGDQPYDPRQVAMSMDMLRGRIAEQALLSKPDQIEALQALPLQQKRYLRPWFAATGRNPSVDEMAACMSDTDPAGIVELIQTPSASSAESSQIAAMAPSLTKCLSAGTRLEADCPALRAALADALYQRVNNPMLSAPQAQEAPK
jgi:hypothetical protein